MTETVSLRCLWFFLTISLSTSCLFLCLYFCLCPCLCFWICIFICKYACTNECKNECTNECTHVRTYARTHVRTYARTHVRTHSHTDLLRSGSFECRSPRSFLLMETLEACVLINYEGCFVNVWLFCRRVARVSGDGLVIKHSQES